MGFGIWCRSVEKCGHQSLKNTEIGIRTKLLPVCLTNNRREATTFLSRVQNLVKIGKELWA